MTVSELIAILQKYPSDATVWGSYETTGRRLIESDIDSPRPDEVNIDVDIYGAPSEYMHRVSQSESDTDTH